MELYGFMIKKSISVQLLVSKPLQSAFFIEPPPEAQFEKDYFYGYAYRSTPFFRPAAPCFDAHYSTSAMHFVLTASAFKQCSLFRLDDENYLVPMN